MDHPRIAPIPAAGNEAEVQELLDSAGAGVGTAANIFRTLANHPGLMRRFLPYGGKLLFGGVLPARERELLILRTAWLCGSDYEWGQHVLIGLRSDLTREEIERVAAGPDAPGWSEADATLLRACDELRAPRPFITDTTWAALAERYDTKALLEISMLVGSYAMIAGMLNSAGVQRDEGIEGFPAAPR